MAERRYIYVKKQKKIKPGIDINAGSRITEELKKKKKKTQVIKKPAKFGNKETHVKNVFTMK